MVIPHRNVPELLEKCLQSVPKKPYIHVLVVDNSDTDKKAQPVMLFGLCDRRSALKGAMKVIKRKIRRNGARLN